MNNQLDRLRQLIKFFDMESCLCHSEIFEEEDLLVKEIKTDPIHLRIGKPVKYASSFEEFVRMTIEAERPLLRPGYFRD